MVTPQTHFELEFGSYEGVVERYGTDQGGILWGLYSSYVRDKDKPPIIKDAPEKIDQKTKYRRQKYKKTEYDLGKYWSDAYFGILKNIERKSRPVES